MLTLTILQVQSDKKKNCETQSQNCPLRKTLNPVFAFMLAEKVKSILNHSTLHASEHEEELKPQQTAFRKAQENTPQFIHKDNWYSHLYPNRPISSESW